MVIECFAQLERVARKMTIKHMGGKDTISEKSERVGRRAVRSSGVRLVKDRVGPEAAAVRAVDFHQVQSFKAAADSTRVESRGPHEWVHRRQRPKL